MEMILSRNYLQHFSTQCNTFNKYNGTQLRQLRNEMNRTSFVFEEKYANQMHAHAEQQRLRSSHSTDSQPNGTSSFQPKTKHKRTAH